MENIRRETPKKPVDNLKLEGTMSVTRKDDFKTSTNKTTVDKVQRTQKYKHNTSSISLGTDTSILKTTNQMNFVSGKDAIKQVDSSSQNPVDGLIIVSTKKVTTVVGGRAKKEPETEYVKRPAKINVIENVSKNTTTTNIENTQNIHKESTSMQRNLNIVDKSAVNRETIRGSTVDNSALQTTSSTVNQGNLATNNVTETGGSTGRLVTKI